MAITTGNNDLDALYEQWGLLSQQERNERIAKVLREDGIRKAEQKRQQEADRQDKDARGYGSWN